MKDEDIDRIKSAQTPEELKDIHNHFLLYIAHEITNMHEFWRKKERERRRLERIDAWAKALEIAAEDGTEPEVIPNEDQLKLKMDSGPYSMCRKGGLVGLAKKFGLTPEDYAENFRSSYQRNEVEQEPICPHELAQQ